jgi:membrane protein
MSQFFGVIKKAVADFSDDDCMSSAAAMAYYAIFSLPPLLVMVVGIAGYFGVSPEEIQKMIQDQWGMSAAGEPIGVAGGGQQQRASPEENPGEQEAREVGAMGIASRVIGVLILVFSATGLFAQLQYTLNRVWEVKPDPKRGGVWAFITKRVLSLGMILVVVFLLLVSMLLSLVIDEIIAYLRGGEETPVTIALGITLNNVVVLIIASLLFAAMFQVLPDAKIAWRDVWFGAIVTGLLFVIGKTLIALYLKNSDLASGWGTAAAAMIGVLVWMYYSSLIMLFGAELTQAWAATHGRAIKPAEGAVPAEAAT